MNVLVYLLGLFGCLVPMNALQIRYWVNHTSVSQNHTRETYARPRFVLVYSIALLVWNCHTWRLCILADSKLAIVSSKPDSSWLLLGDSILAYCLTSWVLCVVQAVLCLPMRGHLRYAWRADSCWGLTDCSIE